MAAPKGNRNAAKSKDWERALRMALHSYEDDGTKRGESLLKIAKHVVKQAVAGEWRAIEEVGNRIDGKPAQAVEFSGGLENRSAQELPDDELAHIASGCRARASEAQDGPSQSAGVH